MGYGYLGKALWVDLTNGTMEEQVLDDRLMRNFLGGYGLGARLLYSRMKPGTDPLGPDNILGIVTGALTGTPAVGGSRYVVVGKSPLTGGWGDANSGGHFGPRLKFAGYDAVFFTGISPKPVYLFIDNGKAELRDASHLWGKDTFETEDLLRQELGDDVEVACVGPAGEKGSLIAAVMNNKGRAAGRSGLGAVMGSKRLKAVAVRGNLKVPLTDEALAAEYKKKHAAGLTGHTEMLREFGTPAIMVPLALAGDSPIKNWDGVAAIHFPEVEKIGGEAVKALQERRFACYQCPIGCGGRMKEGTGEYKYPAGVHKPEYETLAMLGSNCLNSNLDSIILANDLCNRYGLDTISTGACVAMAIECFENGLLSKADTDGLELTWGNHRAIVALTEKIAKREGFGAVLADGVKRAAERIGRGADKFAMHVGGQEIPAHDPKYGFHWALAYRLDATPARHTQGPGMPIAGIPIPEYDRQSQYNRQPGHMLGCCVTHVIQSLGLCIFVYWAYPNGEVLLEDVKAVTGWDFTWEEVFTTGERIADIRHAFNLREGITPKQFTFPGRIAGRPPKEAGPLKGITLDEEAMDREYYAAMQWDYETAKPSKQRLIELGLEDVARDLWP
ncbi:MAG: aldehyde ferredoxin oxidoreductase family protein [Moorellales bacterium]